MFRILPSRELSGKVWHLAAPVVVGMISQTLINLVDTAMVGRLGASALAATGLGGILSWMILGTVGALHVGTQAVASRRYGERNFVDAGRALDNSIAIAFVIGLLGSSILSPTMRQIIVFFTKDPEVVRQGAGYIGWRVMGALPFMVIMAHRGFFNGIGETHLHMRVGITMNILNIFMNWIFIFGNLGAPAMGAAGAAFGSTISVLIGMLIFIMIGYFHPRRRAYGYYRIANVSREGLWRVLRLAGPSGIRSFLIMLGFSIFSGIVARLGTVQMAATNVVLNIMSMAYLPGYGMGTAAATLIGQKLGEGDPEGAEAFGWEANRLGVIMMGVMGILFIFLPGVLLRFFTLDSEVIRVGTIPLRMMGFVQIFDAAGMVLSGALEGAGMNRWVLVVELSVNWFLFLPLTYLLAYVLDLGLIGAWTAFGVYLITFGVLVIYKYSLGTWKKVSV